MLKNIKRAAELLTLKRTHNKWFEATTALNVLKFIRLLTDKVEILCVQLFQCQSFDQ